MDVMRNIRGQGAEKVNVLHGNAIAQLSRWPRMSVTSLFISILHCSLFFIVLVYSSSFLSIIHFSFYSSLFFLHSSSIVLLRSLVIFTYLRCSSHNSSLSFIVFHSFPPLPIAVVLPSRATCEQAASGERRRRRQRQRGIRGRSRRQRRRQLKRRRQQC